MYKTVLPIKVRKVPDLKTLSMDVLRPNGSEKMLSVCAA